MAFFLMPVAGLPGTSGSSVMLPPPKALCSLAARRNRIEKNLHSSTAYQYKHTHALYQIQEQTPRSVES